MTINSLFQPGGFSAGSTTDLKYIREHMREVPHFKQKYKICQNVDTIPVHYLLKKIFKMFIEIKACNLIEWSLENTIICKQIVVIKY